MLVLSLLVAGAADVTRLPDQVEVRFGYGGLTDNGRLVEGDLDVADRRVTEHGMRLDAGFSPMPGLAITAGVELTASWAWRYFNARTMLLEPVNGGGSYVGSPDPEEGAPPVEVGGSGLVGIWVGAVLVPFHEDYARRQRASWRLEVGFRTGSSRSNRWTVREGAGRGAGPGGSALRVAGAFSRRTGQAEPYATFSHRAESPVTVDVVDEQGLGATLDLRPASVTEIRGGCELHADDTDAVSIDLWIGARYHSPERIPSGLLLPNALDSAKTIAVTHSDRVVGLGGLAFHLQFAPFLRLSTGVAARYTIPHTQEHVFAAETSADTMGAEWYAALIAGFGSQKPDPPGDL